MDRERFDALARLFATSGSRRAALGALFGAGLFGGSLEAMAKKGRSNGRGRGGGKGKSKGKDSGKDRDKDRGKDKSKGKAKNRKNKARAEQLPANCCNGSTCTLGKGKNISKCCFEDQNLANVNLSGANAGSANFDNAILTNADFKGANLGKTCFVDADLTGADFKGANTGTAIFCRTTMPDGSINNSGCNKNNRCCPTCIQEDETCSDDGVGGVCCDMLECCGTTCIDTQSDDANCGACANACESPATCQSGECVIVVTPANMRGWQFYNDQIDQPIGPTFESGPAGVERGDGSANLVVTEPPNAGKILSANIFVGTPLSDLAILEYTVHVTSSTSNTAPSLQLGIDFDSTDAINGFQGRLVYVPSATGAFPQGQWDTIDVLTTSGAGNWFFTCQNTAGACTKAALGVCPLANPCTFTEVLTAFPNIRIHPTGPQGTGAGFGFIGFKVGSGEGNVDANVDSIEIKLDGANQPTTIYDFEPNS